MVFTMDKREVKNKLLNRIDEKEINKVFNHALRSFLHKADKYNENKKKGFDERNFQRPDGHLLFKEILAHFNAFEGKMNTRFSFYFFDYNGGEHITLVQHEMNYMEVKDLRSSKRYKLELDSVRSYLGV